MALQQIDMSEERSAFLSEQIENGQYASASDVVGAALDLLRQVDAHEKLQALRAAVDKGDASGIAEDGVFDRIRRSLENRAAA